MLLIYKTPVNQELTKIRNYSVVMPSLMGMTPCTTKVFTEFVFIHAY